jgi:hypothetical protein
MAAETAKEAFVEYVEAHTELVAENAYKVFRVYNHELTEAEATEKFKKEVQAYLVDDDHAELKRALDMLSDHEVGNVLQPELPQDDLSKLDKDRQRLPGLGRRG